ncbi:MAG: VWA domain-containing protein [Myxococcales bacterium]|nr:VWA domain-containing protein [Myxococcales bacterium]MDH3483839.1 VWA domain-containing protein [Myxococcales bacterium]
MSWADEQALWLLLLVPVLVGASWWNAQRRRRGTRNFGDSATIEPLVVGHSKWWRLARALLVTAGIALLIIAFAGPQYGSRTRVLRKRGIDVVIALDFSKSMLAQDVHPSRIKRAKAELERLLNDLDGDRVGLVAFAGDAMAFPMTVDYSAIRLFLRDLGPMDMPFGGTAIGKALIASKRLIESSNEGGSEATDPNRRSRVVVLFTDGEDHEGDPIAAAEELKAAGIQVYTVGIGSSNGEPIPSYTADGTLTGHMKDSAGRLVMTALTTENEDTLKEIASITGGQYFRAREGTVGVDQIRAAFRKLQATEQKARRVTVHENRFALVLLPAFLLIVLEGLLPEAWVVRRRRREA